MAFLEVIELKKHYQRVKAVDNISFSLEKGEIFGLLGPNGAGKSTTISLITTLIKPDSGDILFKQHSIINEPQLIQQDMGFVPQEIALYPALNGLENLRFWGKLYGLRGKHLQNRIIEVTKIIGLEGRLKEKVKNYSGGMKRRLNIGAALLHEPELLIMDEPTVGIDPQSRKHILETVLKLKKQGMTVIYTSHYMEEVEYLCDRIGIMDYGKLIATGTQEQLLQMIHSRTSLLLTCDGNAELFKPSLEAIADVKDISIKGKTVSLTVSHTDVVSDVINSVIQSGQRVLSFDVVKPSLETVFLHLTGRALRD